MFKQMKLLILAIFIAQVFTMRLTSDQPQTTTIDAPKNTTQININVTPVTPPSTLSTVEPVKTNDVIVYDPVYYTETPVFYSYSPLTYYYWDNWYYPDYWLVYRNEASSRKSNGEKKFNVQQATEELSSLKKEIWGKSGFNTEELRKSNKAYDPKWLMAQLKIARALNLEDTLRNKKLI